MRTTQLIAGLISLVGGLTLGADLARAEPYLVVREGAKCSDCHTNLTGGGKRTPFVQIHSHDILHDLDLIPLPPGAKGFNGQLMSFASIGSDLRVRNTTTFEDNPRNGKVDENKAFREHTTSNDISVNEFLMYLQLDLFPDRLMLYADEDFTTGAANREAFSLLYGFLPWGGYVKAGRLFPTYGLRVQDDQAFIRQDTGYTFRTPDVGGEVGIMPGPFFLASSVTNGKSGDKDVAVTVNGYTVITEVPWVETVFLGASFARQSDKRDLYGAYGGTKIWRFNVLGEFDKIDDRTVATASPNKRDDFAAYSEVSILLFDWLNLRGTFDFVKVSGDRDQTRYAIGAEPFISRYLQPRIQYRINNGPGDQPDENHDELWVELHMFF